MKLITKDRKDLGDYFHCSFLSIQFTAFLYNISYQYSTYGTSGREEENIRKQFYGPPINCAELGELGYRLNGYYLVNGSTSRRRIEMVFCWFKLPRGDNESNFNNNKGKTKHSILAF